MKKNYTKNDQPTTYPPIQWTYSIEQNSFSKANSSSASQEILSSLQSPDVYVHVQY